ncbi:hypothetical protein [Streptomyces sp. SID9124]|uniref:hypothetical protein n=1 Tax=Streptomyces sp. SID9124 TaxID=2706108 RepID=UPI0013E0D889|nr:hypothetical protein [Streptomyces sp. SID9124]NED11806.1 hypothetical protein [Streptomyces sp. SID9124]
MTSSTQHRFYAESHPHAVEWLQLFIKDCARRIDMHDQTLTRLRASIAATEAEQQAVREAQNQAQVTLDSFATAETTVLGLQSLAAQWGQGPRLHTVPDQPSAPASGVPTADQQPEGTEADTALYETPSKPPVVITGERSLEILTIMSERSDDRWSAGEVTKKLGEPEDDAGVSRVRTRLDYLCRRGVLEKIESPKARKATQPGEAYVHYRISAAWTTS